MRVTLEEFLGSEYHPNCDFIDGALRPKAWPFFNHSKVQWSVCSLIREEDGFTAAMELTCILSPKLCLLPDVAVMRLDDIQDPFPTRPIHLCVEVLSLGERLSDTVAKCDEYHAWGVPYCWIVDPESRQCWEYHHGGRPNLIPSDGHITAGPIMLSHADIFATLPD